MDIGIVGLGRMGAGVANRLLEGGHRVVAYNRSADKVAQIAEQGAVPAHTLQELVEQLPKPRTVWIYLPSGEVTDEHVAELVDLLAPGDRILDGGNSRFSDSVARAEMLQAKGIAFLDVGTSGGIAGRQNGYCLMIGGEAALVAELAPLWEAAAISGGWLHTGRCGSGHYVKMVHNAVEYGMMQAYGEGMQLLDEGRYAGEINLAAIAGLWQNGSIVRSYLGGLLHEALQDDGHLEAVSGEVADSGEGRWALEEALQSRVPLPAIASALFVRYGSRRPTSFATKVVAILRTGFGGHATNPEQPR